MNSSKVYFPQIDNSSTITHLFQFHHKPAIRP